MEHNKVRNSYYHHHRDLIIILAFTLMFNLSLAKSIPRVPCSSNCLNVNDNSSEEETLRQRFQVCYSEDRPFGQIYDKKREGCFNLLEQGPCSSGELLSMNIAHNTVICLQICDKREDNAENKEEWHSKWRNGECARHHSDIAADEESEEKTRENEGEWDEECNSNEGDGSDQSRDDVGDDHEDANEEGGDDNNADNVDDSNSDGSDNENKSK